MFDCLSLRCLTGELYAGLGMLRSKVKIGYWLIHLRILRVRKMVIVCEVHVQKEMLWLCKIFF